MKNKESIFIENNEYIKKKGEDRFCIYVVGPTLLHPRVINKELKENEIKRLKKTEKNNKLTFDICFHSRIEMLNIYLFLLKKNYNVNLLEESPYEIEEKFYYFKDLIEGKVDINFAGCRNILNLNIDLTLENLDKFKDDLMNVGNITGYKNIWESELSTEEICKEIID